MKKDPSADRRAGQGATPARTSPATSIRKYVEFRTELPKTNVGKILRRELRERRPPADRSPSQRIVPGARVSNACGRFLFGSIESPSGALASMAACRPEPDPTGRPSLGELPCATSNRFTAINPVRPCGSQQDPAGGIHWCNMHANQARGIHVARVSRRSWCDDIVDLPADLDARLRASARRPGRLAHVVLASDARCVQPRRRPRPVLRG